MGNLVSPDALREKVFIARRSWIIRAADVKIDQEFDRLDHCAKAGPRGRTKRSACPNAPGTKRRPRAPAAPIRRGKDAALVAPDATPRALNLNPTESDLFRGFRRSGSPTYVWPVYRAALHDDSSVTTKCARLGSGLIDHNQKATATAMQIAEKKVWAQRS